MGGRYNAARGLISRGIACQNFNAKRLNSEQKLNEPYDFTITLSYYSYFCNSKNMSLVF